MHLTLELDLKHMFSPLASQISHPVERFLWNRIFDPVSNEPAWKRAALRHTQHCEYKMNSPCGGGGIFKSMRCCKCAFGSTHLDVSSFTADGWQGSYMNEYRSMSGISPWKWLLFRPMLTWIGIWRRLLKIALNFIIPCIAWGVIWLIKEFLGGVLTLGTACYKNIILAKNVAIFEGKRTKIYALSRV